jgi:hypothetical protein
MRLCILRESECWYCKTACLLVSTTRDDERHVEETGRRDRRIDGSTGAVVAFSSGQNEEPDARRSLRPSCYEERVERETGCRSSRAGFQKAGWPVWVDPAHRGRDVCMQVRKRSLESP